MWSEPKEVRMPSAMAHQTRATSSSVRTGGITLASDPTSLSVVSATYWGQTSAP